MFDGEQPGRAMDIDHDDLTALVDVLEKECRRVRFMFGVVVSIAAALIVLLTALVAVVLLMVLGDRLVVDEHAVPAVTLLAALISILVFMGTTLFQTYSCRNSLERALHFARARRPRLVVQSIRHIDCSSGKKRDAWIDLASAFLTP